MIQIVFSVCMFPQVILNTNMPDVIIEKAKSGTTWRNPLTD